jgi:hypothetical protein
VAATLDSAEELTGPQMGGTQGGAANALAAREARRKTRYEDMFASKAKNLVKGVGHVINNGVPLSEVSHGGEIVTRQFDTITKSKAATVDGFHNRDAVVDGISDGFWGHPKAGAMKFMAKNFTAQNLGGSGAPYGLVPSIRAAS